MQHFCCSGDTTNSSSQEIRGTECREESAVRNLCVDPNRIFAWLARGPRRRRPRRAPLEAPCRRYTCACLGGLVSHFVQQQHESEKRRKSLGHTACVRKNTQHVRMFQRQCLPSRTHLFTRYDIIDSQLIKIFQGR